MMEFFDQSPIVRTLLVIAIVQGALIMKLFSITAYLTRLNNKQTDVILNTHERLKEIEATAITLKSSVDTVAVLVEQTIMELEEIQNE